MPAAKKHVHPRHLKLYFFKGKYHQSKDCFIDHQDIDNIAGMVGWEPRAGESMPGIIKTIIILLIVFRSSYILRNGFTNFENISVTFKLLDPDHWSAV